MYDHCCGDLAIVVGVVLLLVLCCFVAFVAVVASGIVAFHDVADNVGAFVGVDVEVADNNMCDVLADVVNRCCCCCCLQCWYCEWCCCG